MIVILDYGVGNLTSLNNCFKRLGYESIVSSEPKAISDAQLLVLPGVGRYETAVTALKESGALPALLQRKQEKKPILGICLGMQLFFEGSEESPGFQGLGWLKGQVNQLSTTLPLPHMGWNTLSYREELTLLDSWDAGQTFEILQSAFEAAVGKDMYFVHSYVAKPENRDVILLETRYGEAFPALVGDFEAQIYGLQGHPEKSGVVGETLLKGLLTLMGVGAPKSDVSALKSSVKRLAAMDLLDGQVVRLKQGQYNESTVFGDPEYFAGILREMDFDGLHLINLNGAKGEPLRNLDIICRLACNFPLKVQVGGGIRTWQDAERLLFLGCNVIVSTWFFEDYDSLKTLVDVYPNRISLSLDFKDGAIKTRGWLKSESLDFDVVLEKIANLSLASLILTDIESDGMGSGIRTSFFAEMAQRIRSVSPSLPLVAAGGMPLEATALQPMRALGYDQAVIGLSLYQSLAQTQTQPIAENKPQTIADNQSISISAGDSYA